MKSPRFTGSLRFWGVSVLSAGFELSLGCPVCPWQCLLALKELYTSFLETFKPPAAHSLADKYGVLLTSTISSWNSLCCNSLCVQHRKGCWRKDALNHVCAPCIPLAQRLRFTGVEDSGGTFPFHTSFQHLFFLVLQTAPHPREMCRQPHTSFLWWLIELSHCHCPPPTSLYLLGFLCRRS